MWNRNDSYIAARGPWTNDTGRVVPVPCQTSGWNRVFSPGYMKATHIEWKSSDSQMHRHQDAPSTTPLQWALSVRVDRGPSIMDVVGGFRERRVIGRSVTRKCPSFYSPIRKVWIGFPYEWQMNLRGLGG